MEDGKILLVEDNPDDEFLSLRTLRKCNYLQVDVARDGVEAIAYLFGNSQSQIVAKPLPKLILLDLKLPKMDGFEILQALRSDERTRKVPVIVTSSSRENHDVEKCRSLGVKFYLNKPLDRNELMEAIAALGLS